MTTRFTWVGGRSSVDFTATLGKRLRTPIERIPTAADLSRWFREAGLTDQSVPVSARTFTQAVVLREALYRLLAGTPLATDVNLLAGTAVTADVDLLAGTAVAADVNLLAGTALAADVDVVNRWSARPLPGPRLTRDLRAESTTTDAAGLLSVVARDAVDLLTGPLADRIRTCAADDCSLLFVDESRAGRRRWCSMNLCGARAKMAQYRASRVD